MYYNKNGQIIRNMENSMKTVKKNVENMMRTANDNSYMGGNKPFPLWVFILIVVILVILLGLLTWWIWASNK